MRDGEAPLIVDQSHEPLQCKQEYPIPLRFELLEKIRIPPVLRDGLQETDQYESSIETVGAVAVVPRQSIAGEQWSCRIPEEEWILVLPLPCHFIFPRHGFKEAVVLDVLCRQVGKGIAELIKQFGRPKPL